MDHNNKKVMKKQKVTRIPNWSELNPDLLRCVFERLSFTSLSRAKLVCPLWYCASRGCIPKKNQIPWLLFFHGEKKISTRSRCGFFVPEDKEKVYRSKDFGVEFAGSYCLKICGSWLLLFTIDKNLYILNALTGERIDLPDTQSFQCRSAIRTGRFCFWIDNRTKDYLVVLMVSKKFIKKGYNNWQNFLVFRGECCEEPFYDDKNQELYVCHSHRRDSLDIWDFSGDNPRKDRTMSFPEFVYPDRYHYDLPSFVFSQSKSSMVVSASGDILMVAYIWYALKDYSKKWLFFVYKMNNEVDNKWVQIDSLGDEALIYDLGITVIANDSIPGIKRNSIYYNGRYGCSKSLLFVYDLTTQHAEPLPECVLSSMPFYEARWFFPS